MSFLASVTRTLQLVSFLAFATLTCRPSESNSLTGGDRDRPSESAKSSPRSSPTTASVEDSESESAEKVSQRTHAHGPGAERYCADRTIGGIDRVSIRKASDGKCYQLVLTNRVKASPGLALPEGFGLELALVIDCRTGAVIARATAVTGSVEVSGRGPDGLPERVVKVDVAIQFGADAGAPSMEHLFTRNLVVGPSPCKLH
jgi:hypothetical protein